MNKNTTKQNKTCDMCARRRLRSAWTFVQSGQSLLCVLRVDKDPNLQADSEISDQTGRLPKLIKSSRLGREDSYQTMQLCRLTFTGLTCFVGFVILWLIKKWLTMERLNIKTSQ